jgi:hypothetical protein
LGSITIMPRQKREKGSARERSLSVPESLFGGGQCDETSRGGTSFPIISASLISSRHFPAFSNISCPSSSRALGPLPFPQKLLLLQEHRSSTLASRPAASCMHSRRHACCMAMAELEIGSWVFPTSKILPLCSIFEGHYCYGKSREKVGE